MFKLISFLTILSLNLFAYTYHTTYDYPEKEIKKEINIKYSKIKINNITFNESSFHFNQNERNGEYTLFNQSWKYNKDYTEFLVDLKLIKSNEISTNKDNTFFIEKQLEIYFKDGLLIMKIDGIQKSFEINHEKLNNLKQYNDNQIFIQKEFKIKNYTFDIIFY